MQCGISAGNKRRFLGSTRAHPARVADGDDDVMMTRGCARRAEPGVHNTPEVSHHSGCAQRLQNFGMCIVVDIYVTDQQQQQQQQADSRAPSQSKKRGSS